MTQEIQKLRRQKKGKAFIAKRLGITEKEVDLLEGKANTATNFVHTEGTTIPPCTITYSYSSEVDSEKGTLRSEVVCNFEPKSQEELIELHKVDVTKYVISHYHSSQKANGKFTSSLFCKLIDPKKDPIAFQEEFLKFLSTYKAPKTVVSKKKSTKELPNGCLIINKQDEHINKLDIHGENDMQERMENVLDKIITVLDQSSLSNTLQTIVYIVGSDGFNSEWTSLTTKGTPQSNIASYQETFKQICDYEVAVISKLLEYSDEVEVVYLPGNHDEYVGWHLINWLKSYFRDCDTLQFDETTDYRKYIKYSNTGIMLNHGDAIKPEKLASMFPTEFKEDWSSCDFHYILTGDKHHLLAKDIYGIQFYQIPSLSKATSLWDDKNGHTCSKAELTAFLLEEDLGMINILKRPL